MAAFFGARRQGKSRQVKAYLEAARPSRLIVWDYMDEYGAAAELVATLVELYARARSSEAFALRYRPGSCSEEKLAERFDTFCAIALELGNVTMVCEELQRVTRPSWAPAAWADCLLLGGHRRLRILAVSPRPALVDKNLYSSANVISTCRLNFEDDIARLANTLGVDREVIARIPPYHYAARDMVTGETFHGTTDQDPITARLGRISRPRPRFRPEAPIGRPS